MRDLTLLISAIKLVEDELSFQVARLASTTDADGHIADLRDGYTVAKKYLGILRRYQQGRERRRAGLTTVMGASAPVLGAEEDGL